MSTENQSKTLHVGYPNLGDELLMLELLDEVLASRRLTNDGPMVKLFEQKLAEFLEVEHVVAVANATLGLEILVHALDMTGEVIVPSFTFVATPNAVMWCGGRAVFADAFADTIPGKFTIDYTHMESLITRKTSGIIGVHTFGHACQIERLQDIAGSYGVPLVFDAAHALGCTYGGQPIGRFGNAEVFSFHATKVVNSIEGGAITTNDPDLAATCRQMRNFGIAGYGQTINLGINAKMSELHATVGLVNLMAYDDIVAHNKEVWGWYERGLEEVEEVNLAQPGDESHNYHYVVTEVSRDRDVIWRHLHSQNILARRYFHPGCHRLMPYSALNPDLSLPNTERLCGRVLCLPTGQGVDEQDVDRVCNAIKEAL